MDGLVALKSETWHQSPLLALLFDGFTPSHRGSTMTFTVHTLGEPPRHGGCHCGERAAPPQRPRPWRVGGASGEKPPCL